MLAIILIMMGYRNKSQECCPYTYTTDFDLALLSMSFSFILILETHIFIIKDIIAIDFIGIIRRLINKYGFW